MNNNSRFFFVLLSAGAAVGIGNIWLYPYLSLKHTGLFFIPYLIALLILAVPLLMMEFSAGQYFNKNVVDLFASVRKWLSSIGWVMVFNAFIVMSLMAVVLSWHIIYFFVSFGLQWKGNSASYFLNNVLQVSRGFDSFTRFSLPVFIALIISWVIIYFYIRKGFESMKKAYLLTLPVFVALLFLQLINALTLDNALIGIYAYAKANFANFKALLNAKTWLDSFLLAAISLGIGFGVMHAFARKSGKGFILANSIIAAIFKLLISIAVGFIVFGILGFLSVKNAASLNELVFADFGSEFKVLPEALPYFYKPTLMSMLFFAFFAILFILGASSLAYGISHVLVHKFATKHRNAAIIVAGFGFLAGLLFIIKPGLYIMDIVSHFIIYNILIAILLEALAIGWLYNSEKISAHINQFSILKLGATWRLIVRYFVPLVILVLLALQIKSDYLLDYKNYPFLAVLIFGVGIVAIPIVAAFLMPRRILDRK